MYKQAVSPESLFSAQECIGTDEASDRAGDFGPTGGEACALVFNIET